MASCIRNICTKEYQNLVIGFQVTVKNVGDVFLRQRTITGAATVSNGEIFHDCHNCLKVLLDKLLT